MSAILFTGLMNFAVAETRNLQTVAGITHSETQKKYSRKEAYRASTNRIVLHFGEGIKRVEHIAEILNRKGYPAVALAGGPGKNVSLFVHRSRPINYDQEDVDDGTLGGIAINIYKDRFGGSN